MPDTIACTAELTVDQPQTAALLLFTPEGERAWVPGWDPAFPAAQRTAGPGAVFLTGHGEDTTTWVMVDEDERSVRYARVTPGATAGTVAVNVLDAEPARTRLRVSYDLTALSAGGARWLQDFAAGFTGYIAHWEAAIAAATASGESRRRAAAARE
jgi:hypothetical protein